ncbi:phage tail protein [Citrobacter freundii]|nr:phage tail protein [Citrobacter freundii]
MDEQRRYNLVTREGAEGAIAGNQAISNLRTVFSSAAAEISGQLGNELAPDIRRLTDDLSDWFKGGGVKRIVTFLRNDLYPGVLSFGQGVVFVGKIVYALAKKLAWLLPDEREDQRDVLQALARNGSVDIARLTAQRKGQGEWFEQQLKAHPELPEKVKQSWTSTRGYFGFDSDDETFSQSVEQYLTPKSNETLLNWNATLQQNREGITQHDSATKNSAGAWGNYALSVSPDAVYPEITLPSPQQKVTAPRSVKPQEDNTGGYWETLLQKMDELDKQFPSRQIIDNRKFDYHFEINAAPGQDEKAIADKLTSVTRNHSAFNGDNSLTDGGACLVNDFTPLIDEFGLQKAGALRSVETVRVMMMLGNFAFSIDTTAYNQLTREATWRWSEQERIGKQDLLQYTGKPGRTVRLEGQSHAFFRKGVDPVNDLFVLADQAKPQQLVSGGRGCSGMVGSD